MTDKTSWHTIPRRVRRKRGPSPEHAKNAQISEHKMRMPHTLHTLLMEYGDFEVHDFMHKGIACHIQRAAPFMHYTCRIAIPVGHPLHGVDEEDISRCVDVHGAFAPDLDDGDDMWWIRFHFGHRDGVWEDALMDPSAPAIILREASPHWTTGVWWSESKVIAETKRAAEQLVELSQLFNM